MGFSISFSAFCGSGVNGWSASPSLLVAHISSGMSSIECAVNDGDGKKVYVL